MKRTGSPLTPELVTSSAQGMELEDRYGAHNYHPLPVVLTKGRGAEVWDVEGKRYLDFLSSYSAVNQGHCHPQIIAALVEQADQLTLSSRAFHNDQLGPFSKYITELLGYDRVLPMNSGVEAVETAVKLARRWGYEIKKVSPDQAKIIVCEGNFHGRTMTAVSLSTSTDSRGGYGPYLPGFEAVPFGDIGALERALKDANVVGFLFEPIQGEGGVVVPPKGYLAQAAALCKTANVLLIADEIQTGLGRTGRLLCCEHDGVTPDVLILGKALSGGVLPVSAVLTSNEVMLTIKPGQHGSTFGGNPLACRVAMAALQVLISEELSERAERLGLLFRAELADLPKSRVSQVRGLGLLNAVVMEKNSDITADQVCLKLMERGVLAKPTRSHIIRFAPPLVISENDLREGIEKIKDVISS
jgi:ornithine--oxo-acid transaminase